MKNRIGRGPWTIFRGPLLILAMAASMEFAAQCVDDPSGRTAVILSNQTKYDLVFRIDDDEKGIVPSRKESPEWQIEPGVHTLIAGAIIDSGSYWVWTENEVLKGQVCTWTIEDRKEGSNTEKAQRRSDSSDRHFAAQKATGRKYNVSI